jgi:hypothetical protein
MVRIFLVICIICGILIPTLIIYVDQLGTVTTVTIVEIQPEVKVTVIHELQNRSQVEQFLLSDNTSDHPYTDDYKCWNFARDVIANASKSGIETHYITVMWDTSTLTHAIVMFPTIDNGDVYVDSTMGDWWVNFNTGVGNYSEYSMLNPQQYGFVNMTLVMYTYEDNGITTIHSVRPSPTPTPTPIPTIALTPTPFPQPAYCKECTDYMDYHIQFTLSTGEGYTVRSCWNAQPLQNAAAVEEFMQWDNIESVPYDADSWTCGHYAQHIQMLAATNSIKCGVVSVRFKYSTHAIVAFPTVDDGILYVDPMGKDRWAYVVQWEPYRSWPMNHSTFDVGYPMIWPEVEWFDIYY